MTIYFSTNIPEFRSMVAFNRATNDIANTSIRLETGQRINSGKDDPVGLSVREGLRTEMKGYEAALRNITGGDGLLQFTEDSLASLTEVIQGAVGNDQSNGLFGLLSGSITADNADTVKEAYNDLVNVYNGVVASSTYNGAAVLDVGIDQTFAVVGSDEGIEVALTGGHALTLLDSEDLTDPDVVATLKTTLQTELDSILADRSYVGFKQNALSVYKDSLDSRLVASTQAEGQISNVDLAKENSRLARSELLAQNALNLMSYNQSYASFMVNSIFS